MYKLLQTLEIRHLCQRQEWNCTCTIQKISTSLLTSKVKYFVPKMEMTGLGRKPPVIKWSFWHSSLRCKL